MEKLNLTTTLTAYPLVSPSILSDYVTQESLSAQLSNYVTEAPEDNQVYGRSNGEWVDIDKASNNS